MRRKRAGSRQISVQRTSNQESSSDLKLAYVFETSSGERTWAARKSGFKCLWCRKDCEKESGLVSHLRNRHRRFDFRLELDCSAPVIVIQLTEASGPDAWWKYPFVYTFVLEEWVLGLEEQLKKRLAIAQKCRREDSQPEEVQVKGRGAEPRAKAAKRKALHKQNSKNGHASSKVTPNVDRDKEDFDLEEKQPKRKRRKIPLKSFSNEELLKMAHHSDTHLKTTNEEFDVDSEDDLDTSWIHDLNNILLADLVDVTNTEHHFMCIWNRFMNEDKETFKDDQVPSLLQRFVAQHWQKILDERLEPQLVRHTLNLFDYGVITQKVVVECNNMLAQKAKNFTRKKSRGHESRSNSSQIISKPRSPVKSPKQRRRTARLRKTALPFPI